jgi:hypothetical protein
VLDTYELQLLWTPPQGAIQLISNTNVSSRDTGIGNVRTGFLNSDWWTGTPTLWYPSGNHNVDLSNLSLPSRGNNTVCLVDQFNYATTTTTITLSWTGMKIYRADGSIETLPDGSQTVTGLTANTSYYFYPYWDEVNQVVGFVSGSGSGSPGIAFLAAQRTNYILQQQMLSNLTALSQGGPMLVATPASGTTSGLAGGRTSF